MNKLLLLIIFSALVIIAVTTTIVILVKKKSSVPNPCPSGKICEGNCVDVNSNSMHCGNCNNVCPSGTKCISGKCLCTNGYTLCGKECINTKTDGNNCGSCGNLCVPGTSCSGGICTCPDNKILCNGTCVDIKTDDINCGKCNNTCIGDYRCVEGKCTCREGTVLCNDKCVNISTDSNNCGSCGNICPSGYTCINKVCTTSIKDGLKADDGDRYGNYLSLSPFDDRWKPNSIKGQINSAVIFQPNGIPHQYAVFGVASNKYLNEDFTGGETPNTYWTFTNVGTSTRPQYTLSTPKGKICVDVNNGYNLTLTNDTGDNLKCGWFTTSNAM